MREFMETFFLFETGCFRGIHDYSRTVCLKSWLGTLKKHEQSINSHRKTHQTKSKRQMLNSENRHNQWAKKATTIHGKPFHKSMRTKATGTRGRSRKKTWPAECAKSPKAVISKDFLLEKTEKKANKSVPARWSAKGTYRKASAERDSTTDLNTLVGLRPLADLIAYAHSAWPRF